MTFANPDPNEFDTQIELSENEEQDADKLIAALRDARLHDAIDLDGERAARAALLAVELNSRIKTEAANPELPAHLDPRELFCDEVCRNAAEAVDEYLREFADDLAVDARRMDGEKRETLMQLVAELDTRVGGDR